MQCTLDYAIVGDCLENTFIFTRFVCHSFSNDPCTPMLCYHVMCRSILSPDLISSCNNISRGERALFTLVFTPARSR